MAIQRMTPGCRSSHSQISASLLASESSLVQSWIGASCLCCSKPFIMATFPGSVRHVLDNTIDAPVFLKMCSNKTQQLSLKRSSPYNE